MARSLNQVLLMGNLTRDPELRQTPNGQSVCSFSLALNRSYKDASGEWTEATDYIDIVARLFTISGTSAINSDYSNLQLGKNPIPATGIIE